MPKPAPERAEETEEAGKTTEELAPAPAAEKASEDTEAIRPPTSQQVKLMMVVGRYAVDHPIRLQAALQTAPESVKPALLRAINISVNGYEKALENIEKNPEAFEKNTGTTEKNPVTIEKNAATIEKTMR